MTGRRARTKFPDKAIAKLVDLMAPIAVDQGPGRCWPWPGPLRGGYGVLSVWLPERQKARSRSFAAHRVAWVAYGNRFPNSALTIDHMCCNKACVNPAHLRLMTAVDNSADAMRRLRNHHMAILHDRRQAALNARTQCGKGHEFTAGNIRWHVTPGGRQGRTCLECERQRMLRREVHVYESRKF